MLLLQLRELLLSALILVLRDLVSLASVSSKQFYRILDLPKHLQVTFLALIKLGPSSALDVSVVTGKARALESSYLNQLVTLKLVCKGRQCVDLQVQGQPKVVFSVVLEALDW